MATVFVAHVKLSWGQEADYLIANDVEPGLASRRDRGDNDWNAVMLNALINVPVAPYLKDNRVTPPIATGLVTSLTAVEAGPATAKLLRTVASSSWPKCGKNKTFPLTPPFCTTTTPS